eukprot:8576829-Pyramimonas_sp.AAC.1
MKGMLMNVRMKRITEAHTGQFLPLSVYEKLGCNAKDIEEKHRLLTSRIIQFPRRRAEFRSTRS